MTEIKTFVKQGHVSRKDLIWNDKKEDWVCAESYAELMPVFERLEGNEVFSRRQIFAVASGKGGVGKTVLSTSIGIQLANLGHEVVIIDGDLAGPDLHTSLGILEPKYSFFDFYTLQKDSLNDILLETPVKNLKIISGACGSLGLANPKYKHKQRFIRELKTLHADYIIIDLGAGTSFDVIDFFLLADRPFLITVPEPTSVYEAFGFIKVCLWRAFFRKLKKRHPDALSILAKQEAFFHRNMNHTINDLKSKVAKVDKQAVEIINSVLKSFKPRLILNMVRESADIKEGRAIQAAAKKLLSLQMKLVGHVSYDPQVREAVMALTPILLHAPKSKAAKEIAALVKKKLLRNDDN